MKYFFKVFIFTILLSSLAEASEKKVVWEIFGKSLDSETFHYIDLESIKYNEKYISFNALQDNTKKNYSIKAFLLLDCNNNRIKWEKLLKFSQNMGLGMSKKEKVIKKWIYLNKNEPSVYLGFSEYLCNLE